MQPIFARVDHVQFDSDQNQRTAMTERPSSQTSTYAACQIVALWLEEMVRWPDYVWFNDQDPTRSLMLDNPTAYLIGNRFTRNRHNRQPTIVWLIVAPVDQMGGVVHRPLHFRIDSIERDRPAARIRFHGHLIDGSSSQIIITFVNDLPDAVELTEHLATPSHAA